MFPEHSKQQGLSLIELMIAVTLGIVMTGAAMQFMIGSNQTYSLNDDLSRVQENGRIAMDILAKDIRKAGYQEDLLGKKPTVILKDCSHESSGAAMPCATEGTTNDSDTLPIQYTATASASTDCLGGTPASPQDIITNVYYIQNNNGVNSLYCKGFNVSTGLEISAGQPLIDGIDRMQVLYRIKNGNNFEYKSFDRIKSSAKDLQNITAIRIGLLVSNGLTTGKANNKERKYQLLDSPGTFEATDGHIRRIYTTTIQLNNRHSGA